MKMNSQRSTIDELLERFPPSNPLVIEAVVQDYRAPVYRLALSILDHPDEAEDATQETFIQVAAHLDRYQIGSNFRAWLFTITVNLCHGYLRKRAAQARLKQALRALGSLSGASRGMETRLVQEQTQDQIWDLVDQLPEKQRMVVILRLAHDLSIAEIAQILDIPPKTVYSRLYDAFRKLRGQMTRSDQHRHILEEWML
jgi:RNA polymerase sigma-70 factor (ECF subfamily)